MQEYRNYKKFFNKEEIEPFSNLLTINNISFRIVESAPSFDLTFTGNSDSEIWLQIQSNNFENVDKLLEKELHTDEIDSEHYFNNFTDGELIEVIENHHEWNSSDIALAKELLRKKGIKITEEYMQKLKAKRYADLAKPESIKNIWIIIGYTCALLGGFIAIIIGLSIANTKKTLPDGKKVFMYDRKSRLHAKNILILGVIFLAIGFSVKLYFMAP